ncbi:MAG TPA: DUF3221 domain-containing protein [Symbiobacteriaceae bacterium]|nr:DUF3221 domain-containing protein [Symbiobacteriaceae bacterium]
MRVMFVLALMLSALTLTACSGGRTGGIPTDKPLVTGTITKQDATGRFLVEEKPGQQSGDMKCWFELSAKTTLYRQNGKLVEKADKTNLLVGHLVSVWYSGPVRESYPCQAGADTVLILGGGAQ